VEQALKPLESFRECAEYCPEMIVIPAGKFEMGSQVAEKDRNDNESPRHLVTIAQSFAVSKYPVTFADWDACVSVGSCPKEDDEGSDADLGGSWMRPVINVNWYDAQKYVAWLSKMTGKPYRLLKEAEWEYAARAGTTTAYYWGDEVGQNNTNCRGCGSWGGKTTSPVGSFKPNAFGLYDMVGNVTQWVLDCYHDNYHLAPTDGSARITASDCSRRVVRSGSFLLAPRFSRSARRAFSFPDTRIDNKGFRVGRTLSFE
jgi:formylglycine-generating enzyme required for sulfatase activity